MKKGFTLVELLAVIVILGIVLVLAIPSVKKAIETSYEKTYEFNLENLQSAAKDYFVDKGLRVTGTEKRIINITQMVEENYLKVIKDPDTNEVCDGYVAITKDYKNYIYEPYLKCGDNYISDNYDGIVEYLPVITMLGNNPASININNSYIDAGATAKDHSGVDITSSVVVTSNVDTSIPGAYTVTYTATDSTGNQNTAKRVVNVIDNVAPTITFNPNSYSTYARSRDTVVKVNDLGGLNANSLKYVWSTSTTQPSSLLFTSIYKSNQPVTTPSDVFGVYYLWVTASDLSGNTTVKSSGAFYIDSVNPIVNITGSNPTIVSKGSIYTDAGATAVDSLGTSLTITSSGSVNPNMVGTYTITYTATDSFGNKGTSVRTVNVIDTLAPVITLNGSNPTNINVNSTYADAGATALDDVDGDVTSKITTSSNVNPSVIGAYTVTYTVKDISNNTATKTRTINVIDNILPTVVFGTNGNATYAKTRSTTVTVSDAHTGVNASSLKYVWNTSTTAPAEASITTSFTSGGTISSPAGVTGGYYLWILAKDNAGNTLIPRTYAFNLDNTKPIITMNGSATVTVNKGSTYTDAGATATDAHSGVSGSVTATGTVNPSIIGTYTITYNVSDVAGNAATAVVRTINVVDVSAPVITMLGSNPVNVAINGTYADAGATALDDVDGDVTSKITTSSNVNPNVLGAYTVTYTVKDNANNTATSTRTVNVTDTTPPTLTTAFAGALLYTDPTFISGTNGINGYNNAGDGTVTLTRTTISGAPEGSGYGLTIQNTAGTSTPGLGGFYFGTSSSANKTYITRIVAKIPVGYTLNWTTNPIGTGSSFTWLTSTAGTGDWQEYVCQANAGSTGTFGTTNYYYLSGGTTPTPANPLIWYVAYATVFDTAKWGTTNSVVFTAADSGSGIVGYGINQSSTIAPTFTAMSSNDTIGKVISNITANGTYYVWVKDVAGNTANKAFTVSYVDRSGPTIATAAAGTALYTDPTFASGTNSTNIYNNSGDGTVTLTRTTISGAPLGSGYGLTIQTTAGTSSPGFGGFYFANPVSANKTYITRIVAKIPVGYSINWATNAIGTDCSYSWLTNTAGTGTWQEYIYQVNTGSTGTFATTNFFYLTGSPIPTSASPLTWYVAYATVFDTTKLGTSNSVVFTSSDAASGIVGYGMNQSSTVAPTFTSVTNTSTLNTAINSITTNGTYYVWVKDALGNTSNKSFAVNYADAVAPTISATLSNHQLSTFTNWSLGGAAYIDGSGQLVLPTTGNSSATSPYIPVSGTYWSFGMNGLTPSQSVNNAPYGSVMIGSAYYDINYATAVSDNTYSGNGYAPTLTLNTVTPFSWDGWSGDGPNVYYVRISANADGGYGVAPITLSSFKFYCDGGYSNYAKVVTVTASDTNGIKITKWLSGAKVSADFASAGTTFTNSFEVTSNGTYTIYAEDNAGNKTIIQQSINTIDIAGPTAPTSVGMTFSNGTTNYTNGTWTNQSVYMYSSISGSTDSLSGVAKYQLSSDNATWYDYSYDSANALYGLTSQGTQYRYARAVDRFGNVGSVTTKTIKIDKSAPVITLNGSSSVTVGIGSTYTDAGSSATDSLSGVSGSVTSSSNVNTSNAGTYTVTYNVNDLAGNAAATVTRTVNVVANKVASKIAAGTYTAGQAVTYAGINWHVIRDNGSSVTLLADWGTIAGRMRFDTRYNASYPSCSYSPTGYCGNNVWATSDTKTYLNGTWLNNSQLSTGFMIDDGNGIVRLITPTEYNSLLSAVGAQPWLYSSTISWWWTMTPASQYMLYTITDTGAVNPLMEAFDQAYVRPVVTLQE